MESHHKKDRAYLKKLCKALDVSENRLKEDEYNDWNIVGLRGHIFTDQEYWYLFTSPESVRKWNITKRQLSFMEVSQDGDDEGILRCNRMPSRFEAMEVRKVIGVRPTKKLTEEQRQALISRGYKHDRMGVSQSHIDLNEVPATLLAEGGRNA